MARQLKKLYVTPNDLERYGHSVEEQLLNNPRFAGIQVRAYTLELCVVDEDHLA